MNKLKHFFNFNYYNPKQMFWAFVSPLFLLFCVFFIIPFIIGVGLSFFQWRGITEDISFVGFRNYIELFTKDKRYFESLIFTFKYVFGVVVVTNIFGLLFAVLLDSKIKLGNLFRSAFFLPNVISVVVVGYIFTFIFRDGTRLLFELTNLNIFSRSWLSDPNMAVFAMVIAAAWQSVGYVMVIYIAGLQTIDVSVLEAASVDGAYGIKKFRYITLPLLSPAIIVNMVITITQSFRSFDLNFSLTGGGPGYTTTGMALDVFRTAWAQQKLGYGSSKAVILFIITCSITILQFLATKANKKVKTQ